MFRVDPAKIPHDGVQARCSVCGAVIAVQPAFAAAGVATDDTAAVDAYAEASWAEVDPGQPAPDQPALDVSAPTLDATADATSVAGDPAEPPGPPPGSARAEVEEAVAPSAQHAVTARASDATAAAGIDGPEGSPVGSTAPALSPRPNVPAVTGSAQSEARPRPVNPYLNNTPELRARRLARALVSDLVAYNPQKREQGLRDGTLRQLFREEIRKSWDEYVEQVGAGVAESTPHFQDALNDVLAGGRRVF